MFYIRFNNNLCSNRLILLDLNLRGDGFLHFWSVRILHLHHLRLNWVFKRFGSCRILLRNLHFAQSISEEWGCKIKPRGAIIRQSYIFTAEPPVSENQTGLAKTYMAGKDRRLMTGAGHETLRHVPAVLTHTHTHPGLNCSESSWQPWLNSIAIRVIITRWDKVTAIFSSFLHHHMCLSVCIHAFQRDEVCFHAHTMLCTAPPRCHFVFLPGQIFGRHERAKNAHNAVKKFPTCPFPHKHWRQIVTPGSFRLPLQDGVWWCRDEDWLHI